MVFANINGKLARRSIDSSCIERYLGQLFKANACIHVHVYEIMYRVCQNMLK